MTREWMIDHLEIESTVLHKESEEAQIQMQREGANKLGEDPESLFLHHSYLIFFALNNDFTEQILQQKKNPTKKSGGVTVVEGILGVRPVLWCKSVVVE